jgi:hypothetical protein
VEGGLEPSLDSVAHGARNDNPTRWCFRLESCGHIYVVAIDVIAFNDNIAEMKASPKHDGVFLRLTAICLNHSLLELNCCAERVHSASELNQATVAG